MYRNYWFKLAGLQKKYSSSFLIPGSEKIPSLPFGNVAHAILYQSFQGIVSQDVYFLRLINYNIK